jgi:hypothetical protein
MRIHAHLLTCCCSVAPLLWEQACPVPAAQLLDLCVVHDARGATAAAAATAAVVAEDVTQ